jgi:hypothetical protein
MQCGPSLLQGIHLSECWLLPFCNAEEWVPKNGQIDCGSNILYSGSIHDQSEAPSPRPGAPSECPPEYPYLVTSTSHDWQEILCFDTAVRAADSSGPARSYCLLDKYTGETRASTLVSMIEAGDGEYCDRTPSRRKKAGMVASTIECMFGDPEGWRAVHIPRPRARHAAWAARCGSDPCAYFFGGFTTASFIKKPIGRPGAWQEWWPAAQFSDLWQLRHGRSKNSGATGTSDRWTYLGEIAIVLLVPPKIQFLGQPSFAMPQVVLLGFARSLTWSKYRAGR